MPRPLSLEQLAQVSVPHRQALLFALRQAWPKNWRSRLQTLGTLTALAGSKYCSSQTPTLMGELTNKLGFKSGDTSVSRDSEYAREVIELVARHALLRYSGHALRELQSLLYTRVTNRATQEAAVKIFQRLQEFDLDFISKSRGGEISSLITTGSTAVGALLNNTVMRCIPMIWEMTHLIKRLEKLGDSRFKRIGKTTLAAYSIFTFAYSNRRVAHRLAMTRAEGKVKGRVGESLVNAENVRLMHGGETETRKFEDAADRSAAANVKVHSSLALLNAGQHLILHGGSALASYRMTDAILSGERKIGDLVQLHHTFRHIVMPLNFMGTMFREFKTNYSHIRDYLRIFNIKPTVIEKANAKPLVINRGSITVDNVSFTYPSSSNESSFSLKNIRMRIHGGSRIAIVGPSGGGKSSLIKLISRLYDVDSGSIQICHQDIRDVTLKSLRQALAVVPQETILFNESLWYNVSYGNPEASNAEVWSAIKAAQLEGTIERLPEGVKTLVGERGSRLSGGERQRVAIARCFLKKPAIVLLDEATSNLDANTEKEIQGALRNLQQGRTCVTVAHRLSAIQDVDQIYYMEDGEIQEAGNHGELLSIPDGKYKQLWENQLKHGVDRFPVKSLSASLDTTEGSSSCGSQCGH